MKNSEYMELLKSAIGNESKITEVLSISKTSELQQYLISLGLNPELTELAAVVEITRDGLSNILRNPDCEITDTGITYNKENSLRVEKNGRFYLSDTSYFAKSKDTDEVIFYQYGSIVHETHIINNYGAVIYHETAGVSPFAGEYSDAERTISDGFPMVITESTDGASYGFSDRSVDFGHPIYPTSKKSEFQENYYTFGSRYPKLKEWYDSYFPMRGKDEFECTSVLNEKQHQLDIEKLNLEISDHHRFLRDVNLSNTENQKKLDKLLEYIKKLGKRTPIGKSVADKILRSLSKIESPAKTRPEDRAPAINDSTMVDGRKETTLEKKQRLENNLARLKQEYSEAKGQSYYLKKQIDTIQQELSQIPLIGGSLSRKASKISKTKSSKSTYEDGQEY